MQTRLGPSTGVIALLVFAALVLALVVWTSIRPGRDAGGAAFETTAAPAAVNVDGGGITDTDTDTADTDTADTADGADTAALDAQPPNAAPAAAQRSTAPATLTVRSYDPEGDGVENDELLPLALVDHNATTNWMTVCYADRYAGKLGVGLVADLPAHDNGGELSFEVATAPYTIDVFHRRDGIVPPEIADWGAATERLHDTTPGSQHVAVPAGTTNVLLLFREIGTDPGCTQFTYRGQLGELAFTIP